MTFRFAPFSFAYWTVEVASTAANSEALGGGLPLARAAGARPSETAAIATNWDGPDLLQVFTIDSFLALSLSPATVGTRF
jgi:hypothetical protein